MIAVGGSTVRGLVINRFLDDPTTFVGGNGIVLDTKGGNVIEGNFLGTDTTGTLDLGNSLDGLLIESSDNTIGGTAAAARNVISGNGIDGVSLNNAGATGNLVQGNYHRHRRHRHHSPGQRPTWRVDHP